MYILTPTGGLEKSEDKIFRVQANELDAKYQSAGYQRHERSYKIMHQHAEYTVICYEYRNDDLSDEPIMIMPDFLLQRRPYPLYVYLYAIDLYSSTPEKGQRWAAEATRKKFKLPTFAHTTLGRALKTFVKIIKETEKTVEEQGGVAVESAECITTETSENVHCGDDKIKRTAFRTAVSTGALRTAAAGVLGGKLAGESIEKIIEYSLEMARSWFLMHRRLLL